MYYSHFGLNQPPFKITPHTGFFYAGGNRGAILDALVYAIISGEGIVKVVGEVGSGKTMLCRMLETRLPATVEIIYLANPSLSRDEILHTVADELGLNLAGQRVTSVIRALQEHLIQKYAEGRHVVVFIDEAQAMPLDSLEEIRLLSNLETSTHKLLQIVLFGQPELDRNIGLPQMRQLSERVVHNFNLPPFVKPDVQGYLAFRMQAAGYNGANVFAPDAVRLIAQASKGLVRRINILADKALLAAFSENTHAVLARHVKAAIRDSRFEGRLALGKRLAVGLGLVAIGAALGTGWQMVASGMPAASPPQVQALRPATEAPKGTPALERPATQAAGPTEKDSLLQERLEQTRFWLDTEDASHYTIQLMLADAGALNELGRELRKMGRDLGLNRLYIYPTMANGRKGMHVMFGTFRSAREAQDALARLPAAYQGYRPLLRTVGGIHDELRAASAGSTGSTGGLPSAGPTANTRQ